MDLTPARAGNIESAARTGGAGPSTHTPMSSTARRRVTGAAQPGGVPPYDPVAGAKQSVLVVEDESSIASFVGMYLKRAGFNVRTAETGNDAIEQASAE